MHLREKGFTIVELLIVVAVIAILAAITVVAYNGVQDRGNYSKARADLKHIDDAIQVYKAQTGKYPMSYGATATPSPPAPAFEYQYSAGANRNYPGDTYQANFISNASNPEPFVPNYLDKMPVGLHKSGFWAYSYAYASNGTDYKLLRCIVNSISPPLVGLPDVEKGNELIDVDSAIDRDNICWGYWSAGATTW